jgi:predicted nucleic acid-binding protein
MKGHLLDVNALLAWEHSGSAHHAAFHRWAKTHARPGLWTCALSELGFIRVSMHVFGYSLADAVDAVAAIRSQTAGFIATAPSPRLRPWATSAGRTTDAYLVEIAEQNQLKLATFDRDIPDPVALVIT